jgi:hypothetical protein
MVSVADELLEKIDAEAQRRSTSRSAFLPWQRNSAWCWSAPTGTRLARRVLT